MADDEAPGDYINNRPDLHDCFFLVGSQNQERISTVKYFLINYSPYFRAMLLETDMKEKNSKEEIKIPDHEPDVFKLMLSYVYGRQDIHFSNVNEAMRFHLLVDKCLMVKLKKISSNYLMQHCTTNICKVLECYVLLSINEMEERALKMVQNNTVTLLSSKYFVQMHISILLFIVKQDILNISEVDLWSGVLNWAKHRCGVADGKSIRKAMGEVLKNIRFLAMTSTEFAEKVVPTSVLEDGEVISVFVAMATNKTVGLSNNKRERKPPVKIFEVSLRSKWIEPLNESNPQVGQCTIEVKHCTIVLKSVIIEENSSPDITLTIRQKLNTRNRGMMLNEKTNAIRQFSLSASQGSELKFDVGSSVQLLANESYEFLVIPNRNSHNWQHGSFYMNHGVSRRRAGCLLEHQQHRDAISTDFEYCKVTTINRNDYRYSYYNESTTCITKIIFTVQE